jgi:anti-anti-sigma factor
VAGRSRGTVSVVDQFLSLKVSAPSAGVQLVQVAGELDLLTKPRLTDCVDDVLRRGARHFILDMSGVSFMGASGLQVLVHAKDRCEQYGADLHVTGAAHRAVARLIGGMRLDQVLTMHPTWADALTAIGAGRIRSEVPLRIRRAPLRALSRPAPA